MGDALLVGAPGMYKILNSDSRLPLERQVAAICTYIIWGCESRERRILLPASQPVQVNPRNSGPLRDPMSSKKVESY